MGSAPMEISARNDACPYAEEAAGFIAPNVMLTPTSDLSANEVSMPFLACFRRNRNIFPSGDSIIPMQTDFRNSGCVAILYRESAAPFH